MNAIVKNKSEAELLKLFTEISNLLDLELEFEFEGLKEGGIKEIIKYFKKKKTKRKLSQIIIFFGAILSGVLINVVSDYVNKDSDLDELNKEEKRLNILKLKNDLEKDSLSELEKKQIVDSIIFLLADVHKVKVFKSRYYKNIKNEPKVRQISTTELDENYVPISKEHIIERKQFKDQILENENLEPKTIYDANIEIISPVLKQGSIKWKGIYDGKHINFTLVDTEFKNAVLNKLYSFSNGTSIRCRLEIILTIDEDGQEIIREAKVYDVLEVYDGIQTHTTKKAKNIKEIENQVRLNFDDN
ncbi:hypothetical protein GR160_15485 [Flavobacterium sp. Sd200]|uniref:hypothetical protein n=1 Tax=Flavobacterium sp. Sd200 TaxID=2692211 RepID=UPI00136A7592|nr:hypothetical protein [Flavobacterium sp. Sd200]MXN92631.1 hypothetical protein [Flavobacterium sp. Sd200]